MQSVFRNSNGTSPVAAYTVRIPDDPEYTDEALKAIWPRAYGKNLVIYGITRGLGTLRFVVLHANAGKQTVPYDIRRGISKLTKWEISDPRIDVRCEAALSELGFKPHKGSPRKGMPYRRNNGGEPGVITSS